MKRLLNEDNIIKIIDKYYDADECNGSDVAMDIMSDISSLPAIQPYSEEEIQAMFDKAYQIEVEEGLPSAQPEQQWIPCSERMPQPNEEDADGFIKAYLVQDGRWMDVARWNGDCWIAWGYGTALTNVIAWMPLPEPYAERRTDETD